MYNGLINGSYKAEFIELTENGLRVVSDDVTDREKARAKILLAIKDISVFNASDILV